MKTYSCQWVMAYYVLFNVGWKVKGIRWKRKCYLTLQAVEPIALPFTRCVGVLTNIPVFALFPWTTSLSRTMLAMLDWLSFNWFNWWFMHLSITWSLWSQSFMKILLKHVRSQEIIMSRHTLMTSLTCPDMPGWRHCPNPPGNYCKV